MINYKSAQFFSLYLVLLTLIMTTAAIGFYFYQNSKLTDSLVPYSYAERIVLEQRVFEESEIFYILESFNEIMPNFESSWGTIDFSNKLKENFVTRASNNYLPFSFILTNVSYNLRKVDSDRMLNDYDYRNSFISLGYQFSFAKIDNEDVLNISRDFNKLIFLVGDREKNSFPVELRYNIRKQYLINKEGLVI